MLLLYGADSRGAQSVEIPVSFFVSPTIMKDRENNNITDITLSYTFYAALNQKAR